MDASMVESRRREFLDSHIHPNGPRSRFYWNRDVSYPGMESLFVELELGQHGRTGHDGGVPPRACPSGGEAQSDYRAVPHRRCRVQWIGIATHLDREPSKSPREG